MAVDSLRIVPSSSSRMGRPGYPCVLARSSGARDWPRHRTAALSALLEALPRPSGGVGLRALRDFWAEAFARPRPGPRVARWLARLLRARDEAAPWPASGGALVFAACTALDWRGRDLCLLVHALEHYSDEGVHALLEHLHAHVDDASRTQPALQLLAQRWALRPLSDPQACAVMASVAALAHLLAPGAAREAVCAALSQWLSAACAEAAAQPERAAGLVAVLQIVDAAGLHLSTPLLPSATVCAVALLVPETQRAQLFDAARAVATRAVWGCVCATPARAWLLQSVEQIATQQAHDVLGAVHYSPRLSREWVDVFAKARTGHPRLRARRSEATCQLLARLLRLRLQHRLAAEDARSPADVLQAVRATMTESALADSRLTTRELQRAMRVALGMDSRELPSAAAGAGGMRALTVHEEQSRLCAVLSADTAQSQRLLELARDAARFYRQLK